MRPQTFAFVHLVVVGVVLAVALAAGLALRLELWQPGSLWSGGFYSRSLSIHGLASHALAAPALAGCCGYVVIAKLAGAQQLRLAALAWIGLALWVIGIGSALVFGWQTTSDTGWTLYAPNGSGSFVPPGARAWLIGRLAFGASGLVYAIHLALMIRKASPIKLAFAITFVAAIAYASLMSLYTALTIDGFVEHSYTAAAGMTPATVCAALLLATIVVAGDSPHPALAATALACAVLTAVPGLRLIGPLLIGPWIVLAIWGGGRRPGIAFVLAGCAPALVVATLTQVITQAISPDHFFDTHAIVGANHALAAAIAFAMLSTIDRAPRFAWVATGITSGGLVLYSFAEFRLGALGMPRRYFDYAPDFTRAHQIAGVAAVIAIAGVAVMAFAWLGSRPARHTS